MTERKRRVGGIWWLSPMGAVGLVVVPTLLVAWLLPDASFRRWGVAKEIGGGTYLIFMAGAAALALGSLFPWLRRRGVPGYTGPASDWVQAKSATLLRANALFFWLTVVGYSAIVVSGLLQGGSPAEFGKVLSTQDVSGGEVKAAFQYIPGVTSLTQVGIAFAVTAALLLPKYRYLWRRTAVVVALAALRMIFFAERLALVELVVPFAVAAIGFHFWRWSASRRTLVRMAPLVVVPLIMLLFAVGEYPRSWVFHRESTTQTLIGFGSDRFVGYYATAYNNGHILMEYGDFERKLPYATLEAFWTAPGIASIGLYERLTGRDYEENYANLLAQYANPEFNSPSGLAGPFTDYGTTGGLIFFGAAGVMLGTMYLFYTGSHPLGLLVYPVLVMGLFELPRYIYWTQGRAFPSLVSLSLLSWLLMRPADRSRA